MEQVRTPSHWTSTLALSYRTGHGRPGGLIDDRGLDRERAARPLRTCELLKLLKLDEIRLFLVQVRPQFGHGCPGEKHGQREKTERAIGLKKLRYHPTTWFRISPCMPNR